MNDEKDKFYFYLIIVLLLLVYNLLLKIKTFIYFLNNE